VNRPSRKILDQLGNILLVAGVVAGMGVSVGAVNGLALWLEIVGVVIGLLLVVAGLWVSHTFRHSDPEGPRRPDR
jgi:hypothetical protein